MSQRTIPTISNIPQLAQWQTGLRANLKIPTSPPVPANLTISSKQGGNYLTWSKMKGADGYELDVSTDGNFATVLTTISLTGSQNIAYFDSVPTNGGATPAKRYYRLRCTAGTVARPQITKGKNSSVVSATAISPDDKVTVSSTSRDLSDYDKFNTKSGNGGYRNTGNLG